MSIVIAIIAIVAAMSVSMGSSIVESARKVNTQQKLDAIETGLMAFRLANNRLPCPADLTITDTPANATTYGYEAANPGGCTGGTPAANAMAGHTNNTNIPSGTTVAEGAVPVKTLNLPDEFQIDGWGRKFGYAVWTPLTGLNAFLSYGVNPNCGAITVENAGHGNRSTLGAYALISYGPNGHGGYTKSGSRYFMGSDNADEWTNCHCSASADTGYAATYVAEDPTQSSASDPLSVYDDIVRYKERWQMQNAYDTYASTGSPCKPGFRIDGQYPSTNLGGSGILFADVNGDGKPDLIMTGQNASTGHCGIYVVFGQSKTYVWPDPLNVSTLNGTNGFYADMPTSSCPRVMPMDFNGDGVMDLVLNSYNANSYILFGQTATFPASFSMSTLTNATNPKGMGVNVSGSMAHGNVSGHGNGIEDLIIGNPGWGDYYQSGQAYVIFGTATPPSSLNANTLFPGFSPGTSYATYTTVPFTVTTGPHTISFMSMGNSGAWAVIDNAVINVVSGGAPATFTDPGFETPAQGGGWTACPAGSAWTFFTCDGGPSQEVGLVGNGVYLMDGFPPSPTQGSQAAFLIGEPDSISQTVTLTAGTYTVSFDAAAQWAGGQQIAVSVDGVILNNTNGNLGFVVQGNLTREGLGASVATSDFNGDGVKDILIAANNPSLGAHTGAAYIVWGHPSGYNWPAMLDTGSPIFTSTGTLSTSTGVWITGNNLSGAQPSGALGFDFNGDGIDDAFVYIYNSACSGGGGGPSSWVVFYGQPMASWTSGSFDIGSLNGTNGAYLGCSYGSGEGFNGWGSNADLNGDGKLDFAALMNWPSGGDGLAVYYNQKSNTSNVWWPASSYAASEINSSNGYIFNVSQPTSFALGNINNNTMNDALVGVTSANSNAGEVYAIFGSSAAFPNNGVIDPTYLNGTTGFTVPGVNAGDALGTAVTTGDITGDGIPDIAIAAPGASPNDGTAGGGNTAGSVYVIYGKKTGWFSSVDLSGL